MADTFQGRVWTVSPAMGAYAIDTYINIDKDASGYTGIAPTGVVGAGTLEPWQYVQGVTGIIGANFTNTKHGF